MDTPRQEFGSGSEWDGTDQQGADSEARAAPILRPGSARLAGTCDENTSLAHLVGIFGEINRLAAKSRMLFGTVKAGTGLTGSEVTTLVAIGHASAPPTVAQVGRFLGHPRQVVQRAIKVLERDGFIAVTPNPDHKRAPLLTATEKGERTVEAIDAATRSVVDGLAEGCDVEQLGATHAGLLALREHVDRTLGVEDV